MAEFDWKQLIAPTVGAGLSFLGSVPGLYEANRLRKERERLLKEGAPDLTPMEREQLAEARQRSYSILAPGYAQEMENIAQQQAATLGAAKRAGIGGSNLLNTLSRLNQQGQAARRNLVMRGEQAQRASKEDLQNLAMAADARRQGRVQNWEAKLAAMDAARRQYNAQAAQAPFQGALAFMPLGGFKFGTGAAKPDYTIPSEGTPLTYAENQEYQSQYNRPSASDNVPRNISYVPSNLRMAPTGLERELSMMAAPYTGETEREFLIRNPLKNTSLSPENARMRMQFLNPAPPAYNDVPAFPAPEMGIPSDIRLAPYYNLNR